jgi:hypothetical protein
MSILMRWSNWASGWLSTTLTVLNSTGSPHPALMMRDVGLEVRL